MALVSFGRIHFIISTREDGMLEMMVKERPGESLAS